jgi:hypothetical protein
VLEPAPRADGAPAHAAAQVLLGDRREQVQRGGEQVVLLPDRRVGAARGAVLPDAAAVGSALPDVGALLARAAAARGAAAVPRAEKRTAGRARVVEFPDCSRPRAESKSSNEAMRDRAGVGWRRLPRPFVRSCRSHEISTAVSATSTTKRAAAESGRKVASFVAEFRVASVESSVGVNASDAFSAHDHGQNFARTTSCFPMITQCGMRPA